MATEPKVQPQPPANQPLVIVKGKPYVQQYPTPNPDDRVFYIRKDSRVAGFEVPDPGTPYEGKGQFAKLLKDFIFTTAKAADEAGQYNFFYVNERKNQEAYNFSVDFPYVDKRYPRVTRTYVVLRESDMAKIEPDADTHDPIFNELLLTDHKVTRITDDQILDAVFVMVTRTFERLPGPIITSFKNNQFQQTVTVRAQEIVKGVPPTQSALTENVSQERAGSAKAKNTAESVDTVFPATILMTEIPSMTRELWLGGFEEESTQQTQAGQVSQPDITPGNYSLTEKQDTLYKKTVTIKSLPLPQTRQHKELTEEFGGGVLLENMAIDTPSSSLDIDEGYLVTESRIRNLPNWGKVKMTKVLDGTEWPELEELKTITEGLYSGTVVQTLKKYVPITETLPVGYNPYSDGVFIDFLPHDTWRKIRLKSKILSYPTAPLIYFSTEDVHFPAQVVGIDVEWEIAAILDSATHLSLDNKEGSATATSAVTQKPNLKDAIKEGYRGYTKARITRTLVVADSTGSLPTINVPQVTPIYPVYGSATLSSGKMAAEVKRGNVDNGVKSDGELNRQTVRFGPVLSYNYDQLFYGPYSGSQPVSAGPVTTSGNQDASKNGTFSAFCAAIGQQPTARVTIPQSVPPALVSGQLIVWRVTVTRGLLNLYVVEKIEVYIP